MILSNAMLSLIYNNYKNKNTKIQRDNKTGKITRIINGLYETDKNIPGYLLASSLYGPSYLSFDFALYYYNLIPEKVFNYTCATYNKKKKKLYKTPFGIYIYRDVPKEVYPLDINIIKIGEYTMQIASKEKALCDKLYTLSPLKNIKEIKIMLYDDLRIEKNDLLELNIDKIKKFSELYHSTNVKLLYSYLRRF